MITGLTSEKHCRARKKKIENDFKRSLKGHLYTLSRAA